MLSLAIGILMLSISIILSPFFSGIGKPVHNAIGSGIGFIFTVVFGLLFIPRIGIIGAGFAASISYTMATLYQFIVFFRYSKLKLTDFLLKKEELLMIRSEFRLIFMNKPS
jgi:O-antigen/teichoic acid export membrane protein